LILKYLLALFVTKTIWRWRVPPSGRLSIAEERSLPNPEQYYRGKLTPAAVEEVRYQCYGSGIAMHDALMDRCGRPFCTLASC
jgi:hypothetical protein